MDDAYDAYLKTHATERWGGQEYPSLRADKDACDVILHFAAETNGEMACRAFQAESVKTGIDHTHLAADTRAVRYTFEDLCSRPCRTLTTPYWTGITNGKRTYSAYCQNIEELIPWRAHRHPGRPELGRRFVWLADLRRERPEPRQAHRGGTRAVVRGGALDDVLPAAHLQSLREPHLFVGLPYIAMVTAVIAGVRRVRNNRFSMSSRSSQFLEDRQLLWGSAPWHIGILVVVAVLMAQIIVGLLSALSFRYGSVWSTGTVVPYFWGLATLNSELAENKGRYFIDYAMAPGLAFKGKDGLPLVISAKCTHQGCTVDSEANAEEQIMCPCHISYFSIQSGQPNAGAPAKLPLPQIGWALVDATGKVVASRKPGQPVAGSVDTALLAQCSLYITKPGRDVA